MLKLNKSLFFNIEIGSFAINAATFVFLGKFCWFMVMLQFLLAVVYICAVE